MEPSRRDLPAQFPPPSGLASFSQHQSGPTVHGPVSSRPSISTAWRPSAELQHLVNTQQLVMASAASLYRQKVSSHDQPPVVGELIDTRQIKRSHAQMESDSRHTRCLRHHRERSTSNPNAQPSTNNSRFNLNIPLSTRGGLDLRRPIMSQFGRDIIDLTDGSISPVPQHQIVPPVSINTRGANRPPRFDREIISVDDQEDNSVPLREESPEIQFLRSEPLRTGPRSRSHSTARLAPGRPGYNPGTRSPARRPQVAVRMSIVANQNQPQSWARAINLPLSGHFNMGGHGRGHDELMQLEDMGGGMFQAPGDLDFFAPAFDYEHPSRPQQQLRLPTYNPPSPAKMGFTRSPNESDTLVCPHCDDELGIGDTDVKRQVWVVKACGHVR